MAVACPSRALPPISEAQFIERVPSSASSNWRTLKGDMLMICVSGSESDLVIFRNYFAKVRKLDHHI
jgi:hypothetical protein